jgi:hypothetical protein
MSERVPHTRRQPRRRAVAAGAALLSAALTLAPPAAEAAGARCASPEEQAMFEVAALKSELMVVGIACRQEDSYNAFVQRFRPLLADNDRAVVSWYNRHHGRSGQRASDAYITNLAQSRSIEGQRLGSDFCPRNTGLFAEVMALPATTDLAAYAAGKDLVPQTMPACQGASSSAAAAAPAARRTAAAASSSSRSRKR